MDGYLPKLPASPLLASASLSFALFQKGKYDFAAESECLASDPPTQTKSEEAAPADEPLLLDCESTAVTHVPTAAAAVYSELTGLLDFPVAIASASVVDDATPTSEEWEVVSSPLLCESADRVDTAPIGELASAPKLIRNESESSFALDASGLIQSLHDASFMNEPPRERLDNDDSEDDGLAEEVDRLNLSSLQLNATLNGFVTSLSPVSDCRGPLTCVSHFVCVGTNSRPPRRRASRVRT
jgi:hypothetical protein